LLGIPRSVKEVIHDKTMAPLEEIESRRDAAISFQPARNRSSLSLWDGVFSSVSIICTLLIYTPKLRFNLCLWNDHHRSLVFSKLRNLEESQEQGPAVRCLLNITQVKVLQIDRLSNKFPCSSGIASVAWGWLSPDSKRPPFSQDCPWEWSNFQGKCNRASYGNNETPVNSSSNSAWLSLLALNWRYQQFFSTLWSQLTRNMTCKCSTFSGKIWNWSLERGAIV